MLSENPVDRDRIQLFFLASMFFPFHSIPILYEHGAGLTSSIFFLQGRSYMNFESVPNPFLFSFFFIFFWDKNILLRVVYYRAYGV